MAYTPTVFKAGNEYVKTNAGGGNVMNTVLMMQVLHDRLTGAGLVYELKDQGYKAELVKPCEEFTPIPPRYWKENANV